MSFIELLANEISNLPGQKAHQRFYPLRFEKYVKPDHVRLSAVGIHLFQINSEWHFILIERSEYDGHHSKQIAFPGGKKDVNDNNLEQTARRESEEEINIFMGFSQLIGQITPVYIPVSNFEVYPFIFFHEKIPVVSRSEKEVNEIFLVKCSDLLDDNVISVNNIQISKNKTLKEVPCFILNEKIVWGATALILSEIKELMLRISNSL
jgi:8-oxo-dGTP pyrophosphatase MutT (NUDIX family)